MEISNRHCVRSAAIHGLRRWRWICHRALQPSAAAEGPQLALQLSSTRLKIEAHLFESSYAPTH